MILLFLYLALALVISFLCSIMEAVLLSVTPSHLKILESQGKKSTKRIINIKKNIDRPLSAILSFNTVAHTIGAAGVGAQAIKVFGEAYFGLVSAILTILILVVTEIIPKTIGAMYWKRLAVVSGHIIHVMIIITYPLVILSAFITRLISKNNKEYTTSREEISALADIGTQEGILVEKENSIIQNLILLKNIKAAKIMTPRVVVVCANETMTLSDFLQEEPSYNFSRIPVYKDNRENITGYVLRQEVLSELANEQGHKTLAEIKRPIVMVPEAQPVFSIWETLLQKKEHLALVVDEYGGMDGVVTMEDIIETLLGFEIVDEKDHIDDMQQYALERWKKRKKNINITENNQEPINE